MKMQYRGRALVTDLLSVHDRQVLRVEGAFSRQKAGLHKEDMDMDLPVGVWGTSLEPLCSREGKVPVLQLARGEGNELLAGAVKQPGLG